VRGFQWFLMGWMASLLVVADYHQRWVQDWIIGPVIVGILIVQVAELVRETVRR
jgi:cell division protein FtsW (lipid II flippase)